MYLSSCHPRFLPFPAARAREYYVTPEMLSTPYTPPGVSLHDSSSYRGMGLWDRALFPALLPAALYFILRFSLTRDSLSCRPAERVPRLLPFRRACAIRGFRCPLFFSSGALRKRFSLFSSGDERALIFLFLHVWETMNWRYVMNRSPATSRFGRGIINSALAKYVTACSTKEGPQ